MMITVDDLEKRALEKRKKLINAADFAAGLKEIEHKLWHDAAGDLSRLHGVVDTMLEVSLLLASAPAVPEAHGRWVHHYNDSGELIDVLRKPIFPHELADPTAAVADYLLDNDVVPVTRCKDCRMFELGVTEGNASIGICTVGGCRKVMFGDGFCSLADKK